MKTPLSSLLAYLMVTTTPVVMGNAVSYDAVSPRPGDRLDVFSVASPSWDHLTTDTIHIFEYEILNQFERRFQTHIDADSVQRVCITENGMAKVIDTSNDGSMWIKSIGTAGYLSQTYQLPYIVIPTEIKIDTTLIDLHLGNNRSVQENGLTITHRPVDCAIITWEGDTIGNCQRINMEYTPLSVDTTNESYQGESITILSSQWFAPGYRYPILEATAIKRADGKVYPTQCLYTSPNSQIAELDYDELNEELRLAMRRDDYTLDHSGNRSRKLNTKINSSSGEIFSLSTEGNSDFSDIFAYSSEDYSTAIVGKIGMAVYGVSGILWYEGECDKSELGQSLTDIMHSLPSGEYIVSLSHNGESHNLKITTRCGVSAVFSPL